VTIANQGSADVTGGYYVTLILDGLQIETQYVADDPAAGAEISFSWSVLIPDLKRGTYVLEAVVDQFDSILELDETNNSTAISVKVN
jgi:subtilase family serine protease